MSVANVDGMKRALKDGHICPSLTARGKSRHSSAGTCLFSHLSLLPFAPCLATSLLPAPQLLWGLTCSAPTMLIGLHLKRWLMNLGIKELQGRTEGLTGGQQKAQKGCRCTGRDPPSKVFSGRRGRQHNPGAKKTTPPYGGGVLEESTLLRPQLW